MTDSPFLQIHAPSNLSKDFWLLSCRFKSALNGYYEATLELVSKGACASFNQLSMVAEFIQWSCGSHFFKARVKSICLTHQQNETIHLDIQGVSALFCLKGESHSRVFKYLSLLELCRKIFSFYPQIEFSVRAMDLAKNKVKTSWIQFKESDFQFISRILVENNLDFYMDWDGVIKLQNFLEAKHNSCRELDEATNLRRSSDESSHKLEFCSHHLYAVGEVIKYECMDFVVVQVAIKAHENKVIHSANLRNYFSCEVVAKSDLSSNIKKLVPWGVQQAKQVNYASIDQERIVIPAQFGWDSHNSVSLSADLMQLWVSNQRGMQFIPMGDSRMILFKIDGCSEGFLVSSFFKLNAAVKFNVVKTKQSSLRFSENLLCVTEGSELKTIQGTYRCTVSGNFSVKISDHYFVNLSKSPANFKASSIKLKVGSSLLELDANKFKLNARLIELSTTMGKNFGLARKGDQHLCPLINPDLSPHVGGSIKEAATSVRINGQGASCMRYELSCNGPEDSISQGVSDLLIEGQPAAFMGSMTFHGGVVMTASTNVKSCSTNLSSSTVHDSEFESLNENWLHIIEV